MDFMDPVCLAPILTMKEVPKLGTYVSGVGEQAGCACKTAKPLEGALKRGLLWQTKVLTEIRMVST